MAPSKGQAKATAIAAITSMPSARAAARMSAVTTSAAAMLMFTFFCAMPSLAYSTMVTERAPAAFANS